MPDSSGESPSAVWKNCERKKIEPKTPKNIENDTTFVAANVRLRKKRSGSIGCGARPSQKRKKPSRTRPPAIPPSTTGLVQPSASARTIPYVRPSRPVPASTSPRGSSALLGPRLSASTRQASGSIASAIGTLTQKIQCHEMPSTIAPPMTGPSATPRPATPDHAPIARPRRCSGTASESSVSDSGVTNAAPRPWIGAGDDQRVGGRRERRGGGRRGEQGDAEDEDAPAAEPVAERRAREQEDGVGERVRVDGPLERLDVRAEVDADDGECGGHDEVVERDHEEGDRRDDERPAGTPAGGGCHVVLRVRVVMLADSSCERSHTECDWSLTVMVQFIGGTARIAIPLSCPGRTSAPGPTARRARARPWRRGR